MRVTPPPSSNQRLTFSRASNKYSPRYTTHPQVRYTTHATQLETTQALTTSDIIFQLESGSWVPVASPTGGQCSVAVESNHWRPLAINQSKIYFTVFEVNTCVLTRFDNIGRDVCKVKET